MWLLPIVVAWTPLRNRALAMALPGLNGTITSGSASLGWFSPVVFTEVEIRDRDGNRLAGAATVRTDKTLLQLALSQSDLGTIRIEQPDLALEMRGDGSNAEDVLVPFLKSGSGGGPLRVQLAFVGGTINMHDVAADRRWKIEQFETSLKLEPKNPVPLEGSVSGNAIIDGKPAHFSLAYKERGEGTGARGDGADASTTKIAPAPVQLQAQIEPLPMEMFRPLVARLLPDAQITGLLSGSVQYSAGAANSAAMQDQTTLVTGQVRIDQLDVAAPATRRRSSAVGGATSPLRHCLPRPTSDCPPARHRLRRRPAVCERLDHLARERSRPPAGRVAAAIVQCAGRTRSRPSRPALTANAARAARTLRSLSGGVKLSLASTGDAKSHRWTGQFQASNLAATTAGRPINWSQPISIDFAAHDTPTGPVVEQLECQSSFIHLTASGTPDHFTAGADCDLNRLATELGQFVDSGAVRPAGVGQVTLDWQRAADSTFQATAKAQINNLRLAMTSRVWSEPSLTVNASAPGLISPSGPTRIDRASLELTTGHNPAGSGRSAVGCVA